MIIFSNAVITYILFPKETVMFRQLNNHYTSCSSYLWNEVVINVWLSLWELRYVFMMNSSLVAQVRPRSTPLHRPWAEHIKCCGWFPQGVPICCSLLRFKKEWIPLQRFVRHTISWIWHFTDRKCHVVDH